MRRWILPLGIMGIPAWSGFWIVGNLVFIENGLLEPDFGVIRQALHFNFFIMPGVSLVLGLLYLVLGRWGGASRPTRAVFLASGVGFLLAGSAMLGLRVYSMEIEPYRLRVEHLILRSAHVSKPLRLLHFSDIQSDRVGAYEQRVFARIREMDPDMIVYTGDWVQPVEPATYATEIPAMLELIRTLDPRLGFYATYGDTDAPWYQIDDGVDLGAMRLLGVRPVLIDWEGGVIALKGLGLFESRYPEVAAHGIGEWYVGVPPTAFSLLVGHSPDFVKAASMFPIDLCLAGHTHGGQVRLPIWGAILNDSILPREMSEGLHRLDMTKIHISSGLGTTHYGGLPGIRFLCPPKMTLIEILPD